MIVVDTSVWIDYFRGGTAALRHSLDSLLDEDRVALVVPVRLEILVGAPAQRSAQLNRVLSALPVFYPTDGTWQLIEQWIGIAHPKGQRFGFADLLIAAIAHENDALIWSLDSDFRRMTTFGWIELFQP